jgi:hypothetical protein
MIKSNQIRDLKGGNDWLLLVKAKNQNSSAQSEEMTSFKF